MNFKDIDISIRYRSDVNNIPNDFMIPVLGSTKLYRRAVGFFCTSSLVQLTYGICKMIENNGKIQIVCSPKLNEDDIKAIDCGYKTRENILSDVLNRELVEPINCFEEERLNLLANLIANGQLDIKIAFLEDADGLNIYHEKIAILEDFDGNRISFTGSMNETKNGFSDNFESIYTFCEWKDDSQRAAVIAATDDFDNLWNDRTRKLRIIPVPEIVLERLLKYNKKEVNYAIDEMEFHYSKYIKKGKVFHIPDNTVLHAYQNAAIEEWINQNYTGYFDMCTGAGKTFTALAAMVTLANKLDDKLAVFIVCPYIHLVSQWEEDAVKWGPKPILAHSKSPKWEDDLLKAYKQFRKEGKPFVCISTNDTFVSEKIQKYISRFTEADAVLLIVDEAHNWGAERISNMMPYNIPYRIALSATIKRYMDKKGTQKILDYFGEACIHYELEQAIQDEKLVPYDYFPIVVSLSDEELAEYTKITNQLRKFLINEDGKIKVSEQGKLLIYKRTRILAGATNKINLLVELMKDYCDESYILVYCGAALTEDIDNGNEGRQIDLVTNILKQKFKMSVRRFTAEEDLAERQNIKEYFAQGMYQVVTAIKCLDEGVNIPGIKTAFIMSSSRNPKEFVQRRGRLLRKSKGKEKAVIYDFITLPRDLNNVSYSDFENDKTILVGEIARIKEFGELALNTEVSAQVITTIMEAYDSFFDVDEEMKNMEDYYGE